MKPRRLGHIIETTKAGERVIQVIDRNTGKPIMDTEAEAAPAEAEKVPTKKVPKN